MFEHATADILINAQSQTSKTAAWMTLLSFENRDISNIDQSQARKLGEAIDVLVGKRENQFLFPRLISKISDRVGEKTYVLVEESPLITIPGNSGLSVHVFTLDGSLLKSSVFLTGWRIGLTDIRISYLSQIGRSGLDVSSEPSVNGRDIAKQFYALIDDQVLLIRLEDKRGHLIRNVYGAPNHTFGLTIAGRSAAEWEKTLKSTDTAQVLATLTWLSGGHLNPKDSVPDFDHENMVEAQLAEAVRARNGVKAALKQLSASKNKWVREAAKLASKTEYDY